MTNIYWLQNITINKLLEEYPYAENFFNVNGLPLKNKHKTIKDYVLDLPYILMEDMGVDKEELLDNFFAFMKQVEDIKNDRHTSIQEISITGGYDKSGRPENVILNMKRGEIICIVGPTGSGKSRLLADIEWMAQKDTPTKRQIKIDGNTPRQEWRFSIEHKLVAQLSQNMNFVMDLNVGDFIKIHAESRMLEKIDEKVQEVIYHANQLAGEKFSLNTPLTSLSGGQSRALMVADTACLSTSPIVLIDEIENAGINRKEAMKLLTHRDKIVLIATHDPILALMGNKRIVIKNGGIQKLILTTECEKQQLQRLEELDEILLKYREILRSGGTLDIV